MEKIIYSVSILGVLLLTGCTNGEGITTKEPTNSKVIVPIVAEVFVDGNYLVDTSSSRVAWSGQMAAIKTHTGLIDVKSGNIEVNDGKITNAELVIDMNTIESDEDIGALETHLASADFFDASQYPESKLMINTVELGSDGNYMIEADLTIKEITNAIVFSAIINASTDGGIRLSSTFEIDRSLWNVRYGSDKFFDNLGDKVISDEIGYDIVIIANK